MAQYENFLDEERRRGQLGTLTDDWSGPTVAGEGNPYSPDYGGDPGTSYTGTVGAQPQQPETPAPTVGNLPGLGLDIFKQPPPPEERRGPMGGGGGQQQPQFAPPQQFQMPSYSVSGGKTSTPAITNELTDLLRQRLKDLSNPLDVTGDPIFQNQMKAFNVQSQRDADRQRASLAQRAATGGALRSGGFNTGARSIGEQQGRANQAYTANLAGSRLTQREQQLNQAISMARSVGQDDVAAQLENLKMDLQRQALELQGKLGFADIDLRRYLGESGMGFNYAQLQNQMNREGVLGALG